MPTEKAISRAIRRTAGTVTGAARHGGRLRHLREPAPLDLTQMGFGLAFAILIDATIIRGALLPRR